MTRFRSGVLATLVVLTALAGGSAAAPAREAPFIILQSTTSTQNSGLLDYLLPMFRERSGIEVRPVIVGTGQALRNGRNGDGDVVLVHARDAEDAFVEGGYGVERHDVMYNDFVIVGPDADPARAMRAETAATALAAIAAAGAPFASRGDDSGTHRKELALWARAGLDVAAQSGTWYRETGSGMGATLNTSVGMDAYTLTDRGTWISFRNRDGHRIVFEGDPLLYNPYGVILVNPERHPRVRAAEGQRFIDWLVSDEGQRAIAAFRIDGQQLFFPNAAGGPR